MATATESEPYLRIFLFPLALSSSTKPGKRKIKRKEND